MVVATSEQNHTHSIDVVTSNIGVQKTNEYRGKISTVRVDVPRVGSSQKLMESGHKLMETSDVVDAYKSGQHVLQI